VRTGETRIVGLRLGEVEINLVHGFPGVLHAKFVLIKDDGSNCGQVTRNLDWSEKTSEALRVFAEALEEDVYADYFKGAPSSPDADAPDGAPPPTEPKQF
jgi:2-keto-3-deoxy-galactonokinase